LIDRNLEFTIIDSEKLGGIQRCMT